MKKVISVFLVIVMLMTTGMLSAFALDEYGAVVESGFCGAKGDHTNTQWVLYEDGTLVVSGSGVTTSPDRTGDFYKYNTFVKSVIIEEGITEVADHSFTQFGYTSKLVLPESLKKIGMECFTNIYECYVYVPETIEEIGDMAFIFSKGITVDENNNNYSSDEYGVLFNKDKTELISYPGNSDVSEYIVPDGVEIIHNVVGQYVSNLTKIVFPESLREIGEAVFCISTNLETVIFSEGLEKIGAYSFMMCENIKSIELPSSIQSLGEMSFVDCFFLRDIKIKSNNIEFATNLGLASTCPAEGVSDEQWIELYKNGFALAYDPGDAANSEFWNNSISFDEFQPIEDAVIYIHDDDSNNTAEVYAEANSIKVERIHFYNEWVYDWDKYVRTSKCDLCDMTITEDLEKNTSNDVEIIAPENSDADFEVDKVTDANDDRYVLAKDVISNELDNDIEIVKIFDINLKNKDGVHVQPDGTVKVKLPHDWKHENYKVYRLNDDGTLTDMNAYKEGSHLVFETDHFSVYIVVGESATADTGEENTGKDGMKSLLKLLSDFLKFVEKILEFFGIKF